jgi:general nucleoside transport system permease protein
MSTITVNEAPAAARSKMSKERRLVYIVVGSFVVFSLVRAISGENDLTSRFTVSAALTATLPIMLAGLGGLLSERAGIVNVGLEGMMIAGTWGAGFFGYHFGPWGALLGGAACGAVGGALHALATVTFGVDHVISGVAINLLAFGWTRFLSSSLFKGRGSGSETNSPGFNAAKAMPTIRVPGFGDGGALQRLENHHWPILSDFAGISRGLLGAVKLYELIALLMVPAVYFLVWRTKFGLRLRSSGEKPSAADSLGVNVTRIRYGAVIMSGALAGLGGALLVMNNNGGYQQGQTNNRGFLGLGALIFGNWRPTGVLGGAALFGFLDSLQLTAVGAVRGLYLAAAVGGALAAYVAFRRKNVRVAKVLGTITVVLLYLFVSQFKMNVDLVKALPYIGTLIVLTVFSRRLRPPMASGQPWRKGQIT